MKTETFALLFLLALLLLSGCGDIKGHQEATHREQAEVDYSIIMIEGCEYIAVPLKRMTRERSISHKGNCRNHEPVSQISTR